MTTARAPGATASLRGHAQVWRRWVSALTSGPLRRLAEIIPPDPAPWLLELWQAATRETAARVLLAGWREQLLDGEVRGNALRVTIAGASLDLPLRRRGSFALHALELDALDPAGARLLDDPLAIVEQVCDAASVGTSARARVRAEVLDSIHNLALARLASSLRHDIARAPARIGVAPDDPRLVDPEHFVTDGHPWHPMTRTRVGLHRAEVVRHAADLLADTRVACVELDAGLVRIGGDWLARTQDWLGAAPPGRVRLPIHPAAAARLRASWPELLADGSLRVVDRPALPCRSLLSLRTVVLSDALHLKLACPVHTTSAKRGVSPMSVHNGPEVSRLLAEIQREDPITAALQLMPEPAAAGLEPDRIGHLAGPGRASAADLGAILRLVPETPTGQHAWVCAAIGERWPGTDELVLERACRGYAGGRSERLAALIDDWITKLVPPALRLFSRHGVALELHTQNTLAVIADGRLATLRVRDLGGIRIHAPRLRRHAWQPSFAADSFIVSEDLDEVRGKLEHTVFHAHLTQLFGVAGSLGFDPERGWSRVRELIDRCYAAWSREPDCTPRRAAELASDHEALTRPRVRAKALLRMRLDARSSDYEYTWVDNQLSRRVDPTSSS